MNSHWCWVVASLLLTGCWRFAPASATTTAPQWRTPGGWQVNPWLTSIHGTSLDNLYATAGDTVLHSTDRGVTWTRVSTIKNVRFDGVWATDHGAFAIANYQSEGGDTGGIAFIAPGAKPLTATLVNTRLHTIHSIDAKVFVGGSNGSHGVIVRVVDQSWVRLELGDAPIVAIGGANSTVYALASDGGLWTSTDGGDRYTRSQLPEHEYSHLSVSGSLLIATNPHGHGARSNDAGRTWTPVDVNGAVITLGERAFAWNDTLFFRSSDGGATWALRISGQRASAIFGTSEGLVTVGDDGQLLTSSDGENWQRQGRGIAGRLHAIWGRSDDEVYVVGNDGERGGVIVRVTGRGEHFTMTHVFPEPPTWERATLTSGKSIETRTPSPELRSVWGAGPSLVLVAGRSGTMLRSSDNGATWQPISTGTHADFNAIGGCDAHTIYAVGDSLVLYSHDEGLTWNPLPPGEFAAPLTAIACVGGAVYAAGEAMVVRLDTEVRQMSAKSSARFSLRRASISGHDQTLWWRTDQEVRRSTDGGRSWQTVNLAQLPTAIDATSDQVVAVGDSGEVVSIDASGPRDLTPDEPYRATLRAIWRSPRGEVWVAGEGGRLLHTLLVAPRN